jgi:hypothetical protein
MPRTIFTEGKHVSFEIMMQQVPRSYDPSVESEEQNENRIDSKNIPTGIKKEAVENDDVCLAHKSDKV